MNNHQEFAELALAVIETEAAAINALAARIDGNFARACELLLNCKGRIIITGIGKSGHIGSKLAATFASTGSPAFFVHPAEASHGDMGMILDRDVVIALSYSGTSREVLTMLPYLKRLNIPLISLTGNPQSELAQAANVHLDVSVATEACPLNLAPTASTTTTLVMGDALAVALLQARGFTAEDFARSHPGGNLGRRLLLRVKDVMHTGDDIPRVTPGTVLRDALLEVTAKKLGMTTVVNEQNVCLGIFTDGDLRRALDNNVDIQTTPIKTIMTRHSKTIQSDDLAAEALQIMETFKITSLLVVDQSEQLQGVVHMHDILSAGIN
jgi:arabinose-5-phosphate isomerase